MMRVLLLVLAFGISSSSFAINRNPLIRTCVSAGGEFWSVYAKNKDYPLCFFGSAGVGALALLHVKAGNGSALSVQTYLHGAAANCQAVGATLIRTRDSEGQAFSLCEFSDGSLIESETLTKGPLHPENQILNGALRTAF